MKRRCGERDQALVVAPAVCALIGLLALQFVNAAAEARGPEEIILEAAGVSPIHSAASWHFSDFLGTGDSTNEQPADADPFDTVVQSAPDGGTSASLRVQ
jgi:hypothetical protein